MYLKLEDMKHAPSKHSVRKMTNNQNTAIFYGDKQEQRQQAIETAKLFDTLPHLKYGTIKYLLKN